ncbi:MULTISPECIES: hypothetical protein [Burkholderia]|uniref:Uncharacterized protein n=1 Tax=Burkholderia contaminans TaxID=488447 RepID=A0AAP4QZJ6_9BURK|nr:MULTISPECIES: hypothetical protein [Burkholderia]MBD1410559.1 hypothetical protein [Burkholderia contaminans]MBM6427353.1 hypothetical protein [Burkholderia contaminans]MCA7875670.1 hypothetical protein [Burkholderia contaminans]MCA8104771.1 hypothetical protein [Burkholderia sp. AU36459]MDN7564370.1 hypothetical protein [Burkholderia contaminans]
MNNIEALREYLFNTLQALTDKEKPMEIERAKAVAEVAQVIINSAKVEVEHLKVAGGKGTGFINAPGSTTHRLGG